MIYADRSAANEATAGKTQTVGVRPYYVAQVCGWGLYGVVQYLLARNRGPTPVSPVAVWCAVGLLGTHLLRTYASRRFRQALPQLLFPFATAAVLIPVLMNAASDGASVLLLGEEFAAEPGWLLLAHYFQAVLVISIWCAIFLTVLEARRRRVAETEALRLALVAQVAQFRALRSQLQPHFLFNCLTNLLELIDEDKDRAKQMVVRLSELLRYTLRAERVATVSLKEELSAVRDYLSLEKVRFEERLQVHLDIEPGSLSAQLPPMLLQTLVENAVKHGIARLPAGGDLSIVVRVSNRELRIDVTNAGTLALATQGSQTVGLENARERLRLMYGHEASLTLAALDERTVRAAAVIPVCAPRISA